MRNRLSTSLPVLTGAVGVALLYGRLLVPGRVLADRDIPGLHLPMLTAFSDVARQGIPYWNPWIHGGQPLLANPHYAAFYPPTWLSLVLPVHLTLALLIVFHAAWAYAGAWKLARSWGAGSVAASLAGLALISSGAIVTSPNMLNLFMGVAWLPWSILWFSQMLRQDATNSWLKDAIWAGVALAAMILVGSPIAPLLALLALLCLCFEVPARDWRRLARLPVAGLLGLGLAAVQILPTLRHLTSSARGVGLEAATATAWSTPPVRLFEWIWPRIFGDPMLTDQHLYFGYPGIERAVPLLLSIYCGALVLAFAVGALLDYRTAHRRALGAMMLLGLFLALGRHNPIYEILLVQIPPFSVIRFPEKFLLLTITAIVIAAALYWQNLLDRRERGEPLSFGVPLSLAVVALVLSGGLYLAPMVAPDLVLELLEGSTAERIQWAEAPAAMSALPEDVLAMRAGFLGRETFVSILFWLVPVALLLLHRKPSVPTGRLSLLVLFIVGFEGWYYSRTVNSTVPTAVLFEAPETLSDLPPTSGRIFSDTILFDPKELIFPSDSAETRSELRQSIDRLDPFVGNLWGYAYALTPDPDLMLSAEGLQTLKSFLDDSDLRAKGWTQSAYRYLGAWHVGIVVRRRSPEVQIEEFRRTGQIPVPARFVRNLEVLPLYRCVSRVLFTTDYRAGIEHLQAIGFDLSDFDVVVIEDSLAPKRQVTYSEKPALITVDEEASRLRIDYESTGDAFMVTAITSDRDWRATVDEKEVPVHTTAIGQMGIELPAGRHQLKLEYRNPAVVWGGLITVISLIGGAWVLKGT